VQKKCVYAEPAVTGSAYKKFQVIL